MIGPKWSFLGYRNSEWVAIKAVSARAWRPTGQTVRYPSGWPIDFSEIGWLNRITAPARRESTSIALATHSAAIKPPAAKTAMRVYLTPFSAKSGHKRPYRQKQETSRKHRNNRAQTCFLSCDRKDSFSIMIPLL